MKRSIWSWLFILTSFGLALSSFILIGQEMLPQWQGYQAQYYQHLARATGDPSKARTPLKILQINMPEFRKVDRCITCHVGVDNPAMKGQPQPFATHPDLGIPGFARAHSFQEIGCTVCHHGQGPATTKEQAHGHVPHWEEPLLKKEWLVGACATCHQNIPQMKGGERLVQARLLFDEKGCIGCHMLHGSGMLVGPELDETWDKSEDQFDFKYVQGERSVGHWVFEHFKNPQAVVPGYPAIEIPESPMPNYELTDNEAHLLTALVLSFAVEREREGHPIPYRFRVAPGPAPAEPTFASPVEKGQYLFQKVGCVACHGIGGRGGVHNKNMDIGEEVPSLIYVSDGYTKEELKKVIQDGRYPARARSKDPVPPLWMPAWKDKLSEEEIDSIVEYLYSLHPSV